MTGSDVCKAIAAELDTGFVGASELELIKPTAFLLNVSRGEVVDEDALITALQSASIAGAGLDVYREEPPAEGNALLAIDKVVATPHNASLTSECMDRMGVHAAMGIDDVLSGREPDAQEGPGSH